MKRVLTLYFSHSGNTQRVAVAIQKQVGGDMLELKTVEPYPTAYNTVVNQAKKELAENFHPKLREITANLNDYDIILLGSPVWWYTIAPPIMTFLAEYDFFGKTIAPFVTHGGGGASNSFADVKKLAPSATVTAGIAFRDDQTTVHEIENWIKKII
ncbi:MAG: flavodoxin [Thermoguttaceae bacterium]